MPSYSAWKLMRLRLAIPFFLLTIGVGGSPDVRAAPTTGNHHQELQQAGRKLLEVMRSGDIERLISLLHEKVAFEGDSGMTKRELVRELRRKRGGVYAFLFDSKLHNTLMAKERDRYLLPEHRKGLIPVKSVRDHLLVADDVEIKVSLVVGENKEPPSIVVVGFDWPGRPSLEELPNCTFVWTPRGWKIHHLFSLPARSLYAPWVKP